MLEKSVAVLGENHPNTIDLTETYAVLLAHQERYAEAATVQATVLQRRQNVLGHTHMKTVISMSKLASFDRRMGRLNDALFLMTQVQEYMPKGRDDELGINVPSIIEEIQEEIDAQSK